MAQYDPTAWARDTDLGRRVFNYNVQLAQWRTPGWLLVKTVQMHVDRRRSETAYFWASDPASEREVVRVDLTELLDWRSAQKQLLATLENCMRPDIPRGRGDLARTGDVVLVASEQPSDIPGAILLVRGNVLATVHSVGSVTVDVSKFALALDDLLCAENRLVSRRAAELRDAGLTLPLDLGLFKDEWVCVIASEGELRRRDQRLESAGRQAISRIEVYSPGGAARSRR